MVVDPERNEVFKILKKKNKDILGFKYDGDIDKVGLPHGKGKKKFIYNEKITYDWEMLKSTNDFNTQVFLYGLGIRVDETANYKNGLRHGEATLAFRPDDHHEENKLFHCTFDDGEINGYALQQGIYDTNFREHLVLYFLKGEIVHHFWCNDKSRDRHLKKLKKHNSRIYNITSTDLEVWFTDEDNIFPHDRSWTNYKKFKLK